MGGSFEDLHKILVKSLEILKDPKFDQIRSRIPQQNRNDFESFVFSQQRTEIAKGVIHLKRNCSFG